MKKPAVVESGDPVTILGRIFGTPVVVKGWTWLPITEVLVAAVAAWLAGRRAPWRTFRERLAIGVLSLPVLVGSEWLHNFAHAAVAYLVGRPMDAMRITWGMPLCVYFDLDDASVTPGQHIARALGGPLCNALLLPMAAGLRRLTRPGSIAREVADSAVAANAFLSTASLLPIPGIDGGPILKWGLVARGKTVVEADRIVQKVNVPLGLALGAAATLAVRRKRWLVAAILGQFAALALSIGLGWLREK